MFKTKYYYDPNTLSYRKIEINSKSQLKKNLFVLVCVIHIWKYDTFNSSKFFRNKHSYGTITSKRNFKIIKSNLIF